MFSSDDFVNALFSEDKIRRDNAIFVLASTGSDPELVLQRLSQTDMVDGRERRFKESKYEATLNTLALTYLSYGFAEHATRILQRLILLGSGNPATYNNLGVVYVSFGDLENAKIWFHQAYVTDVKLDPKIADTLPAARNLRGIEPQMKVVREARNTSIGCSIAIAVLVALLLGFKYYTGTTWNLNSTEFLTALVQVDGFVFAFVGTFSIFVLSGIQGKTIRESCISSVIIPLLVFVSVSVAGALLFLFIVVDPILSIIPYAFAIAGLSHTLLLVLFIKLIPFTPVRN